MVDWVVIGVYMCVCVCVYVYMCARVCVFVHIYMRVQCMFVLVCTDVLA